MRLRVKSNCKSNSKKSSLLFFDLSFSLNNRHSWLIGVPRLLRRLWAEEGGGIGLERLVNKTLGAIPLFPSWDGWWEDLSLSQLDVVYRWNKCL